jgi:hypothetical protein
MIYSLSAIHFSPPVFSAYGANNATSIGNVSASIIIMHGGTTTVPWANVEALEAEYAADERGVG